MVAKSVKAMLVWVRDFERINGCFTFTSGVLLNTVLIMLVIKKSSKELQSYNRMLLTNCGFDLFLNIATFLPQLVGVGWYKQRVSQFLASRSGRRRLLLRHQQRAEAPPYSPVPLPHGGNRRDCDASRDRIPSGAVLLSL